jgi:hypothetical protein
VVFAEFDCGSRLGGGACGKDKNGDPEQLLDHQHVPPDERRWPPLSLANPKIALAA